MEPKKECLACHAEKPLAEFYASRKGLYGRTSCCKTCWKSTYSAKLDGKRKTDEGRENLRNMKRSRQRTEAARERDRRHVGKFSRQYPEKIEAHKSVQAALKAGLLVRPESCEMCGNAPAPRRDGASAIHGHHDDYTKPLEVRWLCPVCHAKVHAIQDALKTAPTTEGE